MAGFLFSLFFQVILPSRGQLKVFPWLAILLISFHLVQPYLSLQSHMFIFLSPPPKTHMLQPCNSLAVSCLLAFAHAAASNWNSHPFDLAPLDVPLQSSMLSGHHLDDLLVISQHHQAMLGFSRPLSHDTVLVSVTIIVKLNYILCPPLDCKLSDVYNYVLDN